MRHGFGTRWFGVRSRWIAGVSGLVALVGVVALSLWLAQPPSSTRASSSNGVPDIEAFAALTPYQLTVGHGFDGFLAFSPDGTSIAFSSDRSGALEIYAQGIVPGSTATPLTSNGRQNVQPAWSPDGQFIAYHEMAANGIWIVPSRGGVARKISDFGSRPAWSPDGGFLTFQSLPTTEVNPLAVPGALSTIWIVDAMGRGQATALTTSGEPSGPHLAPRWRDSKRVIFVTPAGTSSGGATTLWSVDAETRTLRQVAAHTLLTPEYTLSPDGRTVYFQARGNGVWWLPLNENDESAAEPRPTGLPAIGAQVAQLAISRDGRRIAWTALASSNHVWATYVRGTSKIAGPLTEGDGIRYGLPQPSSDDRVALVGAPAGTHTSIFLLAPGPALRQLTTDPPNHGGPQWTPGEREIAFVTDHGKGPGYWAVDPETGRERPLFLLAELPRPPGKSQASSAAPSTNIAFSRDFTRLVMAIVQNGTPNLWVASLRGMRPDGRLVQRTFESEGGSYPAWSSDGQWISYQCNEGTDTHVCVVDAEHGERLQLTHVPNGQSWVGGWAPDNDRIVFAARRGAVWNVAAVSRTTQAVQTLTGFTSPRGYVRYPRWDPANDRVVFERSETTGRIWSVALP